jgi:HD-GYP domain-containing protein (c-di-GMP phosphodiesterase class II)
MPDDARRPGVASVAAGHTLDDDKSRRLGLGADCVRRLTTMLRTVRTHGTENVAFQRQVPDFLSTLESLLQESPETSLTHFEGHLYVDGIRLVDRVLPAAVARVLVREFERLQIGGISLAAGVTHADLGRFLVLVATTRTCTDAREFEGRLHEAKIDTIGALPMAAPAELLGPAPGPDAATPSHTNLDRARRTYQIAEGGVRRLLRKAADAGAPNLLVARRVMQPVVDSILRNEYAILGLTALKTHDGYTYRHCLNVGLLSTAMGRRLGFGRLRLAELGVAGLLHDLGKLTVPHLLLHKPGKLSDAEWKVMQGHPLAGARMIARMPGLSRLMLDAMRTSLEHHMQPDGGGNRRGSRLLRRSHRPPIVSPETVDALRRHAPPARSVRAPVRPGRRLDTQSGLGPLSSRHAVGNPIRLGRPGHESEPAGSGTAALPGRDSP